jgi:hypothetical protein
MLRKYLTLLLLLGPVVVQAQKSVEREIGDFNRLVVSPHIDLVLVQGDHPVVRVEYENIDVHEIHVDQSGKTLKLFLEHARIVEKTERSDMHYSRGIYHDARVTAYVTFSALELLEIRGDQRVTVESPIKAKEFRLRIYGENDVQMASVNADYFKVSMFGENDLKVNGGDVEYQKYTLYGENSIEVSDLMSQHSQTNIYGESEISLHAAHELKVTAMGEGIISYTGDPVLNTGLILGEPRIFSRN